MYHNCKALCQHGIDLCGAAAGLAEASRLLLASVVSHDSTEMIEMYYALVRAAKARTAGALAEYRDHLSHMPDNCLRLPVTL
jgi:hypothetical protein